MFVNNVLKTHLETSATVQLESLVLAEWNMNMPDNIFLLGNYRYRQNGPDPKYRQLPNTFDSFDIGYVTLTTTSGETLTLVANGSKEYVFNGTTTFLPENLYTVVLPVASTLQIGTTYTLHNRSIQDIIVKPSGLASSFNIPSKTSAQFVLKSISGTTFNSWKYYFVSYEETIGISGYYNKALNADVIVESGLSDSDIPQVFKSSKEKMKTIYSLEDCILPFRPRSGINKPLYFSGSYMPNSGRAMAERPRWYMPSRYDQFKYWTSYRTENNVEYGTARNILNGQFFIDDAVPFVVYKNQIPANRLVVKMQTGIGTVNLGPFATATGSIPDPLFGEANKKTPSRWKIQYLDGNNWVNAYSFNQGQTRSDNTPIIGPDGYVELEYGLSVPEQYRDIFVYAGTLSSSTLLPEKAPIGYSYLIVTSSTDMGTFYIYTGVGETGYETFIPKYEWILGSESITNKNNFVTDFTSPLSFIDPLTKQIAYREFQYIRGIRIVVETMNKFDSTFDLIEFSPRLVADISNKVTNYQITKILSDVGVTSLPVGQLLASTGTLEIFDDDQSFNDNNDSSIISNYLRKNIKFVFYEIISKIEDSSGTLSNYYVPIKTMYSEGVPQADNTGAKVAITLRDFYFFLESMPAPRLLLTEASLSFAITTLLDFIGFTNYTFKRLPEESDPIIPYFFVAPDQNVAEVLNQLAVATQTAMFFDEYNNFVVMSKNYLMPGLNERATDFVLLGNNNQIDAGVIENQSSGNLPNILSIASQDKKVYNDGKISYTTRYLQRTYGSIRQASMVDKDKNWIYKPALLWEVSGTDSTKTVNEVVSKQSKYSLSAVPINSTLPAAAPTVLNGVVINNTLDLGENVYWLTKFNGYLYANGEVIKYDAAQFNITGIGNVWISDNQEYQRYFAELPFNGKIYPTGLIRIYSIPFYETINGVERLQAGAVYEHGRGQFGTPIVEHTAGINSYWSSPSYVGGCDMKSNYLFTTNSLYPIIIENVYSLNNIFYVNDIVGVYTGDTINLLSGTGELSDLGQTTVSAVNDTLSQAIITNISTSSGTITFTANNTFTPGQKISISGVIPEVYNLSNIIVQSATGSNFTVSNAATGSYVSGGIARSEVYSFIVDKTPLSDLDEATIGAFKIPNTEIGVAGNNKQKAELTTRNSIIKNFMATNYLSDSEVNLIHSTQSGTVQSSALVMNGPSFTTTENPLNLVSYVYKNLNNAYKLFGSRMRIIGKIETNENRSQTAVGSSTYYQVTGTLPEQKIDISGGSGGIAVLLNPQTNNGYYFELVALSESDIDSYTQKDNDGNPTISIDNVVFYKIKKNADNSDAIPIKLWGGFTNVFVDDGNFTGNYRLSGSEATTVYDLSVEYQDIGNTRRFYLYINNKLITTVDDLEPLPIYNNMALFVRGSSRVMFENIYALSENYSQNSVFTVGETLSSVFGDKNIDASESFRKYAVSGMIQATYLTGISSQQPPKYNMYFDEFGTVMRECAYFNIKYDRSYPALYAKISPTISNVKGYAISGFQADSYGAEFLIFNCTDTALNLDETSGNYLRIQGVTFTQDTTYELSVDEYFNKRSNLANPQFSQNRLILSPTIEKAKYDLIKQSRTIYGKNEFSIESDYIQTQDDAEQLMGWIINKVMKPKKAIGVDIFAIPTLQLGDIVTIDYKDKNGLDLVTPTTTRFVVYNISYGRSTDGPSMTVYLSEV